MKNRIVYILLQGLWDQEENRPPTESGDVVDAVLVTVQLVQPQTCAGVQASDLCFERDGFSFVAAINC